MKVGNFGLLVSIQLVLRVFESLHTTHHFIDHGLFSVKSMASSRASDLFSAALKASASAR